MILKVECSKIDPITCNGIYKNKKVLTDTFTFAG